jgi:hypothetical protein
VVATLGVVSPSADSVAEQSDVDPAADIYGDK